MSGFNHYAVQAAIHAVLSGDGTLGGMVSGVFDFVPVKTAYPYVAVGDGRATDASTMTEAIHRVEVTLHVFSRERGRKEANDIMARVHALLHDTVPDIEGCACVDVRAIHSGVRQERDGLTYHGQMRFAVTVQETVQENGEGMV